MSRRRSILLHAARALGLFRLARAVTAPGVRILCYHGAWLEEDGFAGDAMYISAATFERRLETMKRLGYTIVPLSTAVAALRGKGRLPAASVVVTIDDGWFSTFQAMIPALVRHDIPATLYCDTGHLMAGEPVAHMMALHFWDRAGAKQACPVARNAYHRAADTSRSMQSRLAAARDLATALDVDLEPYLERRSFHYMTASELREADAAGLDIQLHTHNHDLADMSPAVVRREIEENRRALSLLLDRPASDFQHFCYPSGVASPRAAAALEALEIESSTTTEQGLAFPGDAMQLLPRILDGEHVTDIKFEAELSGFMHLVRAAHRRLEPLRQGLSPLRRLYARA